MKSCYTPAENNTVVGSVFEDLICPALVHVVATLVSHSERALNLPADQQRDEQRTE